MNSNSNITVTGSNTAPYVLASNRINFDDLDEITTRLNRIAQRERQLLHDFTESIENILNNVSSNSSRGRPVRSTNQITCTVCLDKPRDCVLEPCMHVCCCISCLQLITDNKCPVCRTPIDFYLKLFIC
jgi:rubrerythrin